MAEFQIRGEFSGRTYTFDAPSEDLTPEQVAYAQSVIRQREQEFADYYTATTGEEADLRPGTALGRGIFDLGPTSAYSALGTATRAVGEQTGIAGLANLGSGMEQSAMREQVAEAGRFAAAPRLADAENIGDFLTAAGEGVGQSIPEMGITIGATLGGGLLGGPAGAYGAGAAAATPFFLGRNVGRQEGQVAAGELDEVDFNRALGTAAGQAALNVVGEKVLLAGRALGVSLPTAQRVVSRIAQRGVAGAVAESSTEVLQQAMERAQAEMPVGLDDPDAQAEYFEAAILGGLMGGGLGGAVGAFQPPKPATEDAREDDTATEEPPKSEKELAAPPADGTAPGGVSENTEVSDARDYFEERASMFEFDGSMMRDEAEARAAQETLDMLEADGTLDLPEMSTFTRALRAKISGTPDAEPDAGTPLPPLEAYADEYRIDTRQGELPVSDPAAFSEPDAAPAPPTEPVANELIALGIPPSSDAVQGAQSGALEGAALAEELKAYADREATKEDQDAQARAQAARDFATRLLSDVRPDDVAATAQRDAIADDAGPDGAGVSDTGVDVGSAGREPAPSPDAAPTPDGDALDDAGGDTAGPDGRAGRAPDAVTPAPSSVSPAPTAAPAAPSPMVSREGPMPEGYDRLQGQGIPPEPIPARAAAPRPQQAAPADGRAAAQRELNQYVERSAPPEILAALQDMEMDQDVDAVTTTRDRRAVLKLLRTPVRKGERSIAKSPVAAARRYFGSNYRVDMVLDEIAYDLVAARVWGEEMRTTKTTKADSGPDSMIPRIDAYLLRKGGPAAVNAADWVEQNMSAEALAFMDEQVVAYEDRVAAQQRAARLEAGAAARARAIAEGEKAFDYLEGVAKGDIKYMERVSPGASLTGPVHPLVRSQLRAGSLRGALSALAETYPGRAGRIAAALVRTLPDVPVSVMTEAEMDTAVRLWDRGRSRFTETPTGAYIPPASQAALDAAFADPDARQTAEMLSGRVLLDEDYLTPHLILHEATHALSQTVLDTPSHPFTRQLQTLLDKVKDSAPGARGMEDVHEFLSEAMSNPEFQQTLARINIDGTRVTALQRLRRALTNMLRRLIGLDPKTDATAQDVADRVFFSLLDNPKPQYRGAGELSEISFLPRSARADASPQPANLMEKFTPESAQRVTKMMGNMSVPVPVIEGAIRGLVPLRNLVDMAKDRIPNAEAFYKLLEEHGAQVSNDTNEARNTIARVGEYLRKNPDKLDTFNDMRLMSTLLGLDPRKPDDFYVKNRYRLYYDVLDSNGSFLRREVKGYETQADRRDARAKLNQNIPAGRSVAKSMDAITDEDLAQFRELRSMYKTLGADGQRAYADVLAPFKHYHKRVGDVIRAKLRAVFPQDPTTANSIYNDIHRKILSADDDTFHQPLQRRGDFWVAYRLFRGPDDMDGELRKESFVTAQEREEALADLEAINAEGEYRVDDVTPYEVDMNGRRDQAVPLSFVSDVMQKIESAGKMDDALRQQLVDLVFDAAPERSFVQTWRMRKGRKGFLGDRGPLDRRLSRQDTIELLQQKAFSTARQISDMEYGARLQEELETARNTVAARARPEGGLTSVERARRNQIDQMFLRLFNDYSKAPRTQRSGWSRTITAGTYGMTLGFNVSTAALTFMQVPTIILPHLGAKYGMGAMTGALGRAMRALSGTGGTRKEASIQPDGSVAEEAVDTARADLSLLNVDFDAAEYADAQWQRLRPLAEEMRRRGMDGRTIVSEVLGTDDNPSVNWFQSLVAFSGMMQRHTERFVRETTALATYELEMKKRANGRKLSELSADELADAADAAIYETELTNGTIMAAGAPLWAQGNVGSIIYLYKRFGLHMLNLLGRQVVRSLGRNPDPQDRRIARLQLGTTLGAVALFSGAQGLPFFHAAAAAYDLLLQGDDEEDFETIVRTGLMGELGYNGVVNYVTNANVASRIGLSGMLYREPFNADSKPWLYAQLQAVGGPAVGLTMDAVDRGIPLLADGEIYRGAEALLPSAIANPMRMYRFTTDGPNTMRGDPITGDISVASAAGQFFGFAPADYIRQLEQNAQLKRIDDAIRTKRTRLLKQRYVAYRTGDPDAYRAAMQEIREFNRDNPQNPITQDTLESSLTSHQDSSTRMHHGVLFDRKNEAMLRAMARDWGPVTIYE